MPRAGRVRVPVVTASPVATEVVTRTEAEAPAHVDVAVPHAPAAVQTPAQADAPAPRVEAPVQVAATAAEATPSIAASHVAEVAAPAMELHPATTSEAKPVETQAAVESPVQAATPAAAEAVATPSEMSTVADDRNAFATPTADDAAAKSDAARTADVVDTTAKTTAPAAHERTRSPAGRLPRYPAMRPWMDRSSRSRGERLLHVRSDHAHLYS